MQFCNIDCKTKQKGAGNWLLIAGWSLPAGESSLQIVDSRLSVGKSNLRIVAEEPLKRGKAACKVMFALAQTYVRVTQKGVTFVSQKEPSPRYAKWIIRISSSSSGSSKYQKTRQARKRVLMLLWARSKRAISTSSTRSDT